MSTVTSIRDATRKAMSKPKVDGSAGDAFDPSRCSERGCPCKASIAMGASNRFVCSWHAWTPPDRADDITSKLTEHRWLVDHIAHLQSLYRQAAKHSPWIAAAQTFWSEQPEMLPTPVEREHWNLYLWRLREELGWRIGVREELGRRIGVRKDRPTPREPQSQLPMFEPARSRLVEVEQ